MTINNITINDNTVTITGTDLSEVSVVYLDDITPKLTTLESYTNKINHDVTISNITVTNTSIVFTVDDYTKAGIIVTISDKSMPIINFYSIYKAKVNYLNYFSNQNVCKNCVEKRFNITTLAMLLRDNLLANAYQLAKWEDVILYYNQLNKALKFNNVIWDTADNDTVTYIQFKQIDETQCNNCCKCCCDGGSCVMCKL